MKTSVITLTLALLVTAVAAAQMRPGSTTPPGMGQPQQPGQHIPGVGEPGMGGSSGIPGQDQQQQQTSTPQVDDKTLESRLHDQFARYPELTDVQVQVQNGEVTLQGTVPSKDDRKKAKQLAQDTPGVRKVREKLTVKPGGASASIRPDALGGVSSDSVARNAEQQNNNAGSIAGNTAAESGTATGSSAMGQAGASTSSPQSMSPSTTPAENHAPAGSTPPSAQGSGSGTGGMTGSATATQGSTGSAASTPSGSAASGSNIGAASGTAQGTAGGATSGSGATSSGMGAGVSGAGTTQQTVPNTTQNQRPSTGSSTDSSSTVATVPDPASLQGQIQTSLRNDPNLSNDNINVSVTPNSIELSGNVASGKNKQTAKRIAESYAGNRKVVDHLTVGANSGTGNNAAASTGAAGSSAVSGTAGASNTSGYAGATPSTGVSGTAGAATGTTSGSTSGTGNSTTGTPPTQTTPPE